MANNKILVYKLNVDFRTKASIKAKIEEIDAIIDELLSTALKSVTQGNYAEYELDTGQSKTRIKYTNVKTVTDSIAAYEALRDYYISRYNGSTGRIRLVDESNFTHNRR